MIRDTRLTDSYQPSAFASISIAVFESLGIELAGGLDSQEGAMGDSQQTFVVSQGKI